MLLMLSLTRACRLRHRATSTRARPRASASASASASLTSKITSSTTNSILSSTSTALSCSSFLSSTCSFSTSTPPPSVVPLPSSYSSSFSLSHSSPGLFWQSAVVDLDIAFSPGSPFPQGPTFTRQPTGNYTWFPNETLNTCENALDHQCRSGRANQKALIYDSPVTGVVRSLTYSELLSEVSVFATALEAQGVKKGDTVVIYMPMIPEAVVAMLACARVGAIHSVVFGGFASAELAKRIVDAKPTVIISASCGIEGKKIIHYKPLLDEAIQIAQHQPKKCIIVQRPQEIAQLKAGRDIEWNDFIKGISKDVKHTPVPVKSTDPLYILYTSGTTGLPKGVLRDNGGHIVALKYMMKYIQGGRPGDVFMAASDIGWVVGHTFIVYAPLLSGLTTILYEGKPVGTPDASAFWRVIAQHRVNLFYTAPSAIRAIKKEDPELNLKDRHDTSSLRTLFLAGERADSDSLQWASSKLKVPVLDNWWQTETGWPIVGNPTGFSSHPLFPVRPGSACVPLPGYNVVVLRDDGTEIPRPSEEHGNLAIKLPLPPGTLPTLWNNEARFIKSYFTRFPGYYDTADAGFIDSSGYVWILSRTDDILNVAGHRLSGGVLEEALSSVPGVAEVAVIAVPDEMKGHVPLGIVVVKAGHKYDVKELQAACVQSVRERVGAVAAFRRIVVTSRLPKTRSGKILRNVMRAIAEDEPFTVPPTIEDPAVIEEIQALFKAENVIHHQKI